VIRMTNLNLIWALTIPLSSMLLLRSIIEKNPSGWFVAVYLIAGVMGLIRYIKERRNKHG